MFIFHSLTCSRLKLSRHGFEATKYYHEITKARLTQVIKTPTDANAMISEAQTQFLLTTCFEQVAENSKDLLPVMIVSVDSGRIPAAKLSCMFLPLNQTCGDSGHIYLSKQYQHHELTYT